MVKSQILKQESVCRRGQIEHVPHASQSYGFQLLVSVRKWECLFQYLRVYNWSLRLLARKALYTIVSGRAGIFLNFPKSLRSCSGLAAFMVFFSDTIRGNFACPQSRIWARSTFSNAAVNFLTTALSTLPPIAATRSSNHLPDLIA